MRRWSRTRATLLAAVALSSATVRAEPAAEAASDVGATPGVDDIDAAVQRGIDLRRANQDEEALEVFREALAQAPASIRVRVHLAATYQALGQWSEAARYLREVLQHADDPYIVRHRRELESSLDYVSARLGTLEVRGHPAGAEVFLSGRHLGTMPLDALAVPTGSYVLEVRQEGYYPVVRPIEIVPRSLLREHIDLTAAGPVRPVMNGQPRPAPKRDAVERTRSPALIIALAGLGGASALTAGVAWMVRESAASRWNSPDCLAGERTRGDNCSAHLERGRVAGRVAIAGGVGAGLFLVGAGAVLWLSASGDEPADAAVSGCFPGVGGVSCIGSF